jgi:tetratricopeptide (TPR) repeat protein/transcriptional regulator with XRE-family HTH domain
MDEFPSIAWKDRLRQERIQHNWRQQDLADQLGTTVATIQRWERGSHQPSAYFRSKLCTLFGKSAEEFGVVHVPAPPVSAPDSQETVTEAASALPSLIDPPGLWTIPYLRNLHFTGRDDLLKFLSQQFALEHPSEMTTMRHAVLSQPQAVKGLGGIGKTQIAVEYAYRARKQGRYTHFLWINAASSETILASFQALAERLPNFSARDEKDQHTLIAALLRWLEACPEPWLLIMDNADELPLVQPYLPQQGRGSILLTTRAHAVSWLAVSIEVEQMGIMEGTQLLLHRTGRLAVSDEEINEASNIVMALDGFPLALDQAGAYIEETGCLFRDYLRLYEQHRATLLARRGKQATNYPASVATTWSLSFQQIEHAQPAAAELLRLCAFLAPDRIPEELLTHGAEQWPPLLQEAVTDPLRFNELVEALLAFSLIKRLTQERLLSLHRLVQVVQVDQMDLQEQRQWAERVVRAIHALFPENPKEEIGTWPQCLRYLEQVQGCDRLIQHYGLRLPEAAELLDRAGVYLREHASYSLAEPLFEQGLAIAEQQCGASHPQVASLLYNLGTIYSEQGKYEQAEPLFQQALHVYQHALGPDHPQLISSLLDLGVLHRIQGKSESAKDLLERALHIGEQALGSYHLRVASPLLSLGVLYYEQGKYEQAEPLYQRALRIYQQALGPDHLQLAMPLINLGIIYVEQGKYEQAESLYQRALQIYQHVLRPDHPRIAYPLTNLGDLYSIQGKYEQAERLLLQALHIREQALGLHHPQVAYPLINLGTIYAEQGKYEQAEPILQRALQIWEQALGLHHLQLVLPLTGLANLARDLGQYEQADIQYRRALTLYQEHLGQQDPYIAETLQGLAQLRQMQQQPNEALSLYQQALTIHEQTLGAQHPKTVESHQRLHAILHVLGKTEEAASLEETHLDQTKWESERVTHREQ